MRNATHEYRRKTILRSPSPALSQRGCATIWENQLFGKEGEAIGDVGRLCREAACQRINETLPKDLGR